MGDRGEPGEEDWEHGKNNNRRRSTVNVIGDIILNTFGELENEATQNEEGAAEQNPWWHADLFGTMNLEHVGS
ncbi:hypothetical protein TRIUR3_31579 [Triticum urartu]|uniref:Uncharacterized protein n=1 Tax=Triticum urartu TaxID=4572 RepID=M7ZD49_TRIUA|nr:hypothetical protein TRIUR3_31579 [Triticum urartu]